MIWEKDRGWFTTAPFSEPEVFDFPEGIGPVECVNVEHEEVLLMPRWVEGQAGHLQVRPGRRVHRRPASTLHKLGLDRTDPSRVKGVQVSPARRRGRLPARPGHARRPDARQDVRRALGDRHRQGRPAARTYLYHVVDNAWTMRDYGAQCVVWQTAVNPVVALELLADGTW